MALPVAVSAVSAAPAPATVVPPRLPRVAIEFCTQCKWLLRAAYYAQELLSTFGTTLGEVALQPATGGVFRVTVETEAPPSVDGSSSSARTLWDRSVDGGFPETKELKRRVRDIVAPARDLGHVDRAAAKAAAKEAAAKEAAAEEAAAEDAKEAETQSGTEPVKTDGAEPAACEDCQ